MLAALKPAPVTMMLCGAPFFLEDFFRLSGLRQNDSKKSGSLSNVRISWKPVESCIEFAVLCGQLSCSSFLGMSFLSYLKQ